MMYPSDVLELVHQRIWCKDDLELLQFDVDGFAQVRIMDPENMVRIGSHELVELHEVFDEIAISLGDDGMTIELWWGETVKGEC
jgi:hypothetical protein